MALGTAGQTVTTAANFIPELWSDEVIATYKSNLVLGNLVTKINHSGKKGDTIHIPTPTRGSANAKAANTQSLRRFYTEDAGYALAKQVDDDLFIQSESLQGGTSGANTWAKAVIGGDGVTLYNTAASTNTGNGSDITDAGIRKMILTLDNADVPMDNRCIVLPPIAMNDMLGINRFTEQQYIGDGSAIKTGKIGAIYGMDVFISSNCPVETATDTSTLYRVGLMLHKDALALVEQMGVRSQTQYKQEYLGDLFTSDTLYGVGELRDNAGIAFVVPST